MLVLNSGAMESEPTSLPRVLLLRPRVFGDARGFFYELFRAEALREHGIVDPFVQANRSSSVRGTLRGLHYQLHPRAQGKLVEVLAGEVFDVAVDLRRGSPHFGRWAGAVLRAEEHQLLWVPPGFAHGFLVLSERAEFLYFCTAPYAPELERSVRWDDPAIGIVWPANPDLARISPKDAIAPPLAAAQINFDYLSAG